MRILLTNDDGIDAPGLHALRVIADELAGPTGEVWVSAPETNQSGAGHSLSLNEPLRMREVASQVYAVRGTPTDSVIMGMRHVLKGRLPDLVLSGINRGANIAEDVTYSGTIAAAMEGTLLGIPSIALSQAYGFVTGRKNPYFACARAHAPDLIRKVLKEGIPRDILVNLNFPDCAPGDVQGTAVTVQGKRDTELLKLDERTDGRGFPYYWIVFSRGAFTPGHGTDLEALKANKISVTPLKLDLTDEPTLTRYALAFA